MFEREHGPTNHSRPPSSDRDSLRSSLYIAKDETPTSLLRFAVRSPSDLSQSSHANVVQPEMWFNWFIDWRGWKQKRARLLHFTNRGS